MVMIHPSYPVVLSNKERSFHSCIQFLLCEKLTAKLFHFLVSLHAFPFFATVRRVQMIWFSFCYLVHFFVGLHCGDFVINPRRELHKDKRKSTRITSIRKSDETIKLHESRFYVSILVLQHDEQDHVQRNLPCDQFNY